MRDFLKTFDKIQVALSISLGRFRLNAIYGIYKNDVVHNTTTCSFLNCFIINIYGQHHSFNFKIVVERFQRTGSCKCSLTTQNFQ